MVDFQERDTRRGLAEDEPDEDEAVEEADEPSEPAAEPEDEAGEPDAAELAAEAAAEQEEATEMEGDADDETAADEAHDHDDQADGQDVDGDHADEDDHDGHEHDGHDHADHDHGSHDHDHGAHDAETLGVAVVTVSSTRSLADDPAGDAIVETFDADGHEVVTRELIGDDLDGIQRSVNALAARGDVDVVVTTGGTGVTPDDVTPEAVEPLFDRKLPGFGELFRSRSREQIGSRVVATRAVGGLVGAVPVFTLPGSEAAVRLGVEEIILPEAPHLVGLATRTGD